MKHLWLSLGALLLVSACRPTIDVTNESIQDLDSLDKVMGVLADTADPGFDMAESAADGTLTDA